MSGELGEQGRKGSLDDEGVGVENVTNQVND